MAGTGDEMIRRADNAAKAATKAREEAGRAQASPGHSQRLADAQRAESAALREAEETRSRWS